MQAEKGIKVGSKKSLAQVVRKVRPPRKMPREAWVEPKESSKTSKESSKEEPEIRKSRRGSDVSFSKLVVLKEPFVEKVAKFGKEKKDEKLFNKRKDLVFYNCNLLPEQYRLEEAGDHFWRYGLRHRSERVTSGRIWFWQYLTLLIHVIILARSIVVITKKQNKNFCLAVGDIFTLIDPGAGSLFIHVTFIACQIFLIYSQLRFLVRARFEWFGLHDVLKGRKALFEIGIFERSAILQIVKRAKLTFKFAKLVYKYAKILMTVMYLGIMLNVCDDIYELIWSFVVDLFISIYRDNKLASMIWQLAYFYVGSFYFERRLCQVSFWINQMTLQMNNQIGTRKETLLLKLRWRRIQGQLCRIQRDIARTNKEFKYYIALFLTSCFVCVLTFGFYSVLTPVPSWFYRRVLGSWALMFNAFFWFLFKSGTMVVNAGREVHKNCLKLAVKGQGTLPLSIRLKLLTVIERYSPERKAKKKIGFNCLGVFMLSSNRCLAITMAMISVFLQMVQFSWTFK